MVQVKRKVSLLKILAVILAFTVSFFTGKFAADWGIAADPKDAGNPRTKTEAGYELPVNRLNVLLLGTDARKGEEDARTDSIMLVSIDRETKKIAVVSVPRDTMVEIKGHGTNKINSANLYGGPDLARETVEELLGVEIPYYVKTNFNGFKEIIDILGGVDINVDKRMYYPAEDINLKPGQQRLNGYDALGYVRYRHDALGDINRAERQQIFLKALANEMLRPVTIIKAPMLVPKLMAAVETNLGMADAILVAKATSSLNSDNVMTATLPGVFYNYKGASYWKVDQDEAHLILKNLFAGVRVATISGPDVNVPAQKSPKKPEPAPESDPDSKQQSSPDKSTDNGGQNDTPGDAGRQGNLPDGTGQNQNQQNGQYPGQNQDAQNPGQTGQDPNQSGQYPGQGQNGQYPGQEQNGQYPGQNQGGQVPDQNTSGQVIINGPNSGDPLNKPVQNPGESADTGQNVSAPGGNTSSGVVYEG